MKQSLLLLFLFSIIQSLVAKEWKAVNGTSAPVLVGVTAAGKFACAACGASGVGAFAQLYDSTSWSKIPMPGGLLLDTAVSASGSVIVGTSLLPIFLSTDGGETFMTVESFGGTSQSANIFGEMKDKFALVGSFIPSGSKPPVEYTYGVLSSVDSGATWTLSATTPLPYARYGAFPADNIWYVSGGTWGADPQAQRTEGSFPLSSRFQIVNGTIVEMPLRPHPKRTNADTPTGWFGYIAKTTDGGKSWSQVFSSDFNNDYYYFNEISCANELVCVAVAEGYTSDGGDMTLAFTTSDGGATWTQSFTSSEVSLMGAAFVNTNDVWIVGTAKSGREVLGQYRLSTDGGKTFSLVQSLSDCLGMDLSFGDDEVGYSVCLNSSGSSGYIAMYL